MSNPDLIGNTAAIDLLCEIETAEHSRKIFDTEYATMQRALAANLYTKAELFEWIKSRGFALSQEVFFKWWIRKAQQVKRNHQGDSNSANTTRS
ncbi:MAG TPA: hypothetical protein VJ577_20220 [Burkholderiaceae bacterium]|nr:hypothetical protein [Burkholderiaceae bacterium]